MNKKILLLLVCVITLFTLVIGGCNKKEEEKKAILSTTLTSYELIEGEDTTLFYTITNKKDDTKLVVEIDDNTVVKIENDIIYGLKKGSAVVTIYLEEDKDNKITLSIVVKEKPVDKPTITINNKVNTLALFEDYNLEATVSDKSSVIWSTSDESIASVTTKGTVTGIKEGKATITASSKNFPDVKDSVEIEFSFDAWKFMESIQNENVLVKNITAYGATEATVKVLGSVCDYSFSTLNIIEAYGPITDNKYKGQVATEAIMELDGKGCPRPGIYLEDLKYIVYHDTANIGETADAKMHNDYLYGAYNKGDRARSWHYTVDDKCIYHNVPDNEVTWQGDSYEAYAKSIGIETCVNVGSDFYRTWQSMGKLVASLLSEYGLDISAVKQHYDFNQKDCPKTLRNNGLYPTAVDLIKAELMVAEYMEGYTLEFKSLSPMYLDDTGKVIAQPKEDTRLAYEITITDKDGNKETKLYHSNIEGSASTSTYSPSKQALDAADAFDLKASKWDGEYSSLSDLLDEYNSLTDDVKALVATYDYLKAEENKYLSTYAKDSSIVVNKVFVYDGAASISKAYSYIELKNISKVAVTKDITLYINSAKSLTKSLGEITLKPNQTYLIAFGDIIYNGGTYYDFIVPNVVVGDEFDISDATIIIKAGDIILDKLGLDNASDKEEVTVKFSENNNSIARKQAIDTDNNARDFGPSSIEPSAKAFINDAVLDFDYSVLALGHEVTLADEAKVNALLAAYEELDDDEKKQVTMKNALDMLFIEIEGIKNPDLAVVKKAILAIPSQIVDDFEFPKKDGLVYAYKDNTQSSIYNIETGEYTEVIHEYTPVEFSATYGTYSEDFTVNFGVCEKNDQIIYVTGAKKPDKGITSEGFGTKENQESTVGFGGVAIRVEGKVFFIGKNCLIELDDTNGTALTRVELRPYGKSAATDINNNGFVAGAPAEYKGTGILYHNNSTSTLTFDLTDTYGRANAGSYGYAKCFFSLNDNNEYAIRDIVQHTGENFSTDNYQVELAPGEYIWCPHTYETNVEYGTWFMFPGPSAAGGMLEEGTVAEFVYYKIEDKD